MDETELKYAEEEMRDQQLAQNVVNTGRAIDSFSSDIADKIESRKENSSREKDKDSINKREKNQSDHSSRFGGRKKKDDDEDNGKKSDLGDKDGLEDKDGLDKDKSKDDKSSKDKDAKGSDKSLVDQVADEKEDGKPGFFTKKWNRLKTKIKIYLIIAGVVAAFFLVFMFIALVGYGFDLIFGSISSYFGVSETDTQEGLSVEKANGLLTSEEYMINPATNEQYTREELVEYLKNDGVCKTTTLSKIIDFFDTLFDNEYRNYCGYYRYIGKRITELEERYTVDSNIAKLDRGLITTSLFYGFGNQADYYDYNENVDLTTVEDIVNAYAHYDSLQSIIDKGDVLNIDNISDMIDSSLLVETGLREKDEKAFPKTEENISAYYVWNIREEPIEDSNETIAVGYCDRVDFPMNAHYSALKWAILMRWGKDASEAYEEELRYTHKYDGTSDECKLGMSDAELLAIVIASSAYGKGRLDGSVRTKNNYFVGRGKPKDLSPFDQKANTETSTVDTFVPFGDMELNYRNGFAYTNFPAFKKSIDDNSNIDLSYDYITTPKQIEDIVQNILQKKKDVNYYLDFEDLDSNDYTPLGDYVIGASCEGYITAAPDAIQVKVNDCDGRFIRTTSFKDYIMGVAYGEVSDSGDNYVLSEMVAAISYALHRRSNYLKGTTITMRSGNCDQVYCPMSEGCHSQKAQISCGSFNCTSYYPGPGWHGKASKALQEKYSNYYETAKNYLVVSNGKPHSAHYVSSIQLGWKEKSNRGIPFTQIIQEEYQDEGAQLVKCDGVNEATDPEAEKIGSDDVPSSKVGNKPTGRYNLVAPDKGKFYGFSYDDAPEGRNITMNPEWISANIVTINTNCPQGGWSEHYKINKYAQSNFKAAYTRICTILTNGVKLSDGSVCKISKSDLINGGTFVQRKTSSGNFSLHAYGIAQDWNYTARITYNGVTYKPYYTQGASAKAEYDRFVAALGKEEHCKNVNYILWKYAFQPSGFNWGGNWSVNSWDGMHFEVKY